MTIFFFFAEKHAKWWARAAVHPSRAVSSVGKRQERPASRLVSSSAPPQPLMVLMLPLFSVSDCETTAVSVVSKQRLAAVTFEKELLQIFVSP